MGCATGPGGRRDVSDGDSVLTQHALAPRKRGKRGGKKGANGKPKRSVPENGTVKHDGPVVTNYAAGAEGREALPINAISERLFRDGGGWPRRVGGLLFADADGVIRWLERPESIFAWIGEWARVQWAVGSDKEGFTFTPKVEFVAHLQARAQEYEAVEELPHEPPIPGAYYGWRGPADYQPTGEYLSGLLEFFDNPATPHDAAIIRAMFLTPAWGGLPGTRPAFAIMAKDRGCGKSTLADAVGELYGGAVEVESDGDETRVVQRLLAPSALLQRVVRVDNIKSAISSGLLEGLVTSSRISGHRLYVGEAHRPNFLTWVLTGNAIRLSRDFADRSFIIRLERPKPATGWRESVFQYIAEHRARILADVVDTLASAQLSGPAFDRWQSWTDGVLLRCTVDAGAAVAINQERRNEQDDDLDEADAILSAVLAASDLQWTTGGAAFVAATEMTKLVNRALGENWSAKKVASILEGHIEAGRLKDFHRVRTMGARGYEVRNKEKAMGSHDGYDGYDG